MSVCVVGNGPLSEQDRKFIQASCDTVYRFNHMHHMKENEKCDVHIIRQCGKKCWWGINTPPPKFVGALPTVMIGSTSPPNKDIIKKISNAHEIYNGVKTNAKWGFTSGTIVLSDLQQDDNVKEVNVLGMNFTKSHEGSQHDTNEKEYNEKYCTKCKFHKTVRNDYRLMSLLF